MKNRDQYKDFLINGMSIRGISFGVDKTTGEPKVCDSFVDPYSAYHVSCEDCKFYNPPVSCCLASRLKWLDQEYDKWEGYHDLKRGDVVFVKMGTIWLPVIFVCIECDELVYTSCADDDGEFPFQVDKESDPRHVRKDIRRVELHYEEQR